MIDWNIFWNNIFPGLIIVTFSSLFAYILIHRYQMKKNKNEIKDSLLLLDSSVNKKYSEWYFAFLEVSNAFYQTIPKYKILKKDWKIDEIHQTLEKAKEGMKKIQNSINDLEQIANNPISLKSFKEDKVKMENLKAEKYEYGKISADLKSHFVEIKNMDYKLTRIIVELENLKNASNLFEKSSIDFRSNFRLLLLRVRLQLKLKIQDKEKINVLESSITNIFEEAVDTILEKDDSEIKDLKKKMESIIPELLETISELILSRKIQSKQTIKIYKNRYETLKEENRAKVEN